MATCPRCGTPAPDEGRFCRSCGGYLAAATSGPDGDDTERMPVQDPGGTRPPGIPAIDDEDVPQAPEPAQGPGEARPPGIPAIDDEDVPQAPAGDAFVTARLPMTAYPVEAPAPDWDDAPDQGWYQDPDGQQPPPPGQGFPPFPPYGQQSPAGPPPFPQEPPYGQAPPPYGGQGSGGYERAGYYPYDESPPQRGNRARTVILAVIGAVAVVVLVVGGALFISSRGHGTVDAGSTTYAPASRHSSSGSASSRSNADTPQEQATAVNGLLNRAVSGKSMLTTAYGQALSCKISPAAAATQFDQAAKNRRAIVASARRTDTSKLPHGARIRQQLIRMYNTSAKADDAFADWARAGETAGDSCLKGNAKRAKGNSLSVKAGKQKKSFTKAWNPVARTYHQPQRTEKSL